MPHNDFWHTLETLVASCPLTIDRPQGSPHPRYPTFVYPYDYGYLEHTQGGDGSGIDVWVGSLPEKTVTAVVCTVDPLKRDAEVKILLARIIHQPKKPASITASATLYPFSLAHGAAD